MSDEIKPAGFHAGDGIIITGAAQGLGRGIALRMAQSAAKLALWDIQEEGLKETAALCRSAGAEEVRVDTVDVSDEAFVEITTISVINDWGCIFGLVNNAGIFPRSTVLGMELELWEKVLRINLTGYFLCARAVGRNMVDNNRGAIVNISSGRALVPRERAVHYGVSKAGIIALTKGLAKEWATNNVRVNSIMPGVAETAQPLEDTTLEELRSRGSRVPLGRIGQPADIASVAHFLLSADATYMTGQSLGVNGGAHMTA